MAVLLLHQQLTQLLKRGDLLHGLLQRAHMLDAVRTKVGPCANEALAVRRTVERRVVEHHNDIVRRDMHVCVRKSTYRSRFPPSHHEWPAQRNSGCFRETPPRPVVRRETYTAVAPAC